jgi:hypothetical protein
MKLSYCVAALVILAAPAFARIGETEAQIEKRYGKAASGSRTTKAYFHKDLFVIVTFDNGVSGIETYQKRDRGTLTAGEISSLLEMNGGGMNWRQEKRNEFDFHYQVQGRLAEYNAVTNTLTVADQETLKRINANRQGFDLWKMQGF